MTSFQLRQSILLLITAVIWGSAFVAQSIGMDSVGPFTFTTSRTLLGAIVLLPLVVWRRTALVKTDPQEALRRSSQGYRRALLMGGLSCGLCLFAGEAFQQFGLVFHTEAGKAGFITSLYIVLVPVMSTFLGRRSNLLMWTSVAVACAGLWYLCVPPEGISIALGDFFVFATIDTAAVILTVATLSFLGLGVAAPAAEWGMMLAEAKNVMTIHPGLMLAPGLAILAVSAAFGFAGDGLESALRPKEPGRIVPDNHTTETPQTEREA